MEMTQRTETTPSRTTLCGVEFATKRIAKSKILKILRSGRAVCESSSYDGFRRDEPIDAAAYADSLEKYWPATMHAMMSRGGLHLSTHNGYVRVIER